MCVWFSFFRLHEVEAIILTISGNEGASSTESVFDTLTSVLHALLDF
jgi:hypothetical protein